MTNYDRFKESSYLVGLLSNKVKPMNVFGDELFATEITVSDGSYTKYVNILPVLMSSEMLVKCREFKNRPVALNGTLLPLFQRQDTGKKINVPFFKATRLNTHTVDFIEKQNSMHLFGWLAKAPSEINIPGKKTMTYFTVDLQQGGFIYCRMNKGMAKYVKPLNIGAPVELYGRLTSRDVDADRGVERYDEKGNAIVNRVYNVDVFRLEC